ncbi:MAG TPA: hypothetical protein VKJ45_16485 [Blastocatellia bacterium]|nr:hypothetical protein [Blastocatellia bacterium]
MRRTVSLVAIALFLLSIALMLHGCSKSQTEVAAGITDTFAPDLNDPKLKERLGDDDGYSLAVLYGSDIHGSLETCG